MNHLDICQELKQKPPRAELAALAFGLLRFLKWNSGKGKEGFRMLEKSVPNNRYLHSIRNMSLRFTTGNY